MAEAGDMGANCAIFTRVFRLDGQGDLRQRHPTISAPKSNSAAVGLYLASISDADDPVALEGLQAVPNRGHVRRIIPETTFSSVLFKTSVRGRS